MKYIIKIFLYLFLNFLLVLIIGHNLNGYNSDLIIAMYIFLVISFVILNEKLIDFSERLEKIEKELKAKDNENIKILDQ